MADAMIQAKKIQKVSMAKKRLKKSYNEYMERKAPPKPSQSMKKRILRKKTGY